MSPDAMPTIWSAARQGEVDILRTLLSDCPQAIDLQAEDGCTALHYAALGGSVEAVSLLLAAGSDPNARAMSGYTPLHYAAFASHGEIFRLLIDAGSDLGAVDDSLTTTLHAAASGGDGDLVAWLLAEGMSADTANLYGELPVHRAAQRNHVSIVQRLLDVGTDPHPIDRYGMSLMHKAAVGGAVEAASWLLDRNFDGQLGDIVGDTPLHSAASLGRLEIADALLGRGVPVHARNHEEATPLHHAAGAGHAQLVSLFLSHGANTDAVDAQGQTPLHKAAMRGHTNVASQLTTDSSATARVDGKGRSAADLAALYGRTKTWEQLTSDAVAADPPLTPSQVKRLIDQPVRQGEMMAWYLGHSGWAVRTHAHLFILDYAPGEPEGEEASLVNGRIDPIEWGQQLTVMVLTSHHHGDHFDRRTLAWNHPQLRRVYGWDAPQDCPGFRFTGQEFKRIGNAVVASIPATDAGSAFLIEADGVSFYHAGDHAASRIPVEEEFSDGVSWLADQFAPIQAAFLPVFGCGLPSPETLQEGNAFTIQHLKPAAVFPMHIGWTSYFYRQFAHWIRESNLAVAVGVANQPGDRFYIRDGSVKQVWS